MWSSFLWSALHRLYSVGTPSAACTHKYFLQVESTFVCGSGKCSRRSSYSPSKLCQSSGRWWNVQIILYAPPRPPPPTHKKSDVGSGEYGCIVIGPLLPINFHGNFRSKKSRRNRNLKMRKCSVLKNSQLVIRTLSHQNRHKELPQLVNVHHTNHSAWVRVSLPTLSFI